MKNKKIIIPYFIGIALVIIGILILTVFSPSIPMGQQGWFERESARVPGIFAIFIGAFIIIASTMFMVAAHLSSPKVMAKNVKRISDQRKELEEELKKNGVYDEYRKLKKYDIDNEFPDLDFENDEENGSYQTKSKAKYCEYCGSKIGENGSCSSCGAKQKN